MHPVFNHIVQTTIDSSIVERGILLVLTQKRRVFHCRNFQFSYPSTDCIPHSLFATTLELFTTRHSEVKEDMNKLQVWILIIVVLNALLFAPTEGSQEFCNAELQNFCGVSSQPNSYRLVFQSRMCLHANKDTLSKACGDFLNNESPSIIESCYDEVSGHCNNADNDKDFDVSKCVNKLPKNKLRTECRVALLDFMNSPELAWSSAVYNAPNTPLKNLHHIHAYNLRGFDSKGEK